MASALLPGDPAADDAELDVSDDARCLSALRPTQLSRVTCCHVLPLSLSSDCPPTLDTERQSARFSALRSIRGGSRGGGGEERDGGPVRPTPGKKFCPQIFLSLVRILSLSTMLRRGIA